MSGILTRRDRMLTVGTVSVTVRLLAARLRLVSRLLVSPLLVFPRVSLVVLPLVRPPDDRRAGVLRARDADVERRVVDLAVVMPTPWIAAEGSKLKKFPVWTVIKPRSGNPFR